MKYFGKLYCATRTVGHSEIQTAQSRNKADLVEKGYEEEHIIEYDSVITDTDRLDYMIAQYHNPLDGDARELIDSRLRGRKTDS